LPKRRTTNIRRGLYPEAELLRFTREIIYHFMHC